MIRFCSWQRRLALTGGIRWKATSSRVEKAESSVQDKAVKPEVKPFSAIPSPPGSLPFIGHIRLLKDISLSELAFKLFKEHGKIFRFDFIGYSSVFVADPSAVEKSFRNEGKYPSRSFTEANVDYILKQRNDRNFFVFQSGEEWRDNRSKLGKQLMPANVYGYCPGFNKVSRRFIRNVYDVQNDDGFVEDVRDLIRYWSLEVAAHFVFGADIDSIKNKGGLEKELQDAVGGLVDTLFDLQAGPPLYKVFPTKAYREFNKYLDKLIEIGQVYADQYTSDIKERAAVSEEKFHGMGLLEQWLIEGKMSTKDAISHSINMLAAGMDTTAHTTAFVLYTLSKHPEVQEKAYKQITSVLGNDEEPDGDSLQKMPYLGHHIKETQRLYHVTPYTARWLETDIELLNYHIPAKTTIFGGLETMGQDPTLFKDPLKFNPDRWTTDDIHPFTVSGEEWRANRSKLGKQLMPANVYGYCPGFNKVARRFIRNVYDVQNDDGFVEDARDLIRYWSLEVATHFVYGANLDCRNDKEGLAKELQDAVGGLLDCIFDLQTTLPLFKIFPTKAYKDFNKNMDKLIEIGQVYADKYSSDIEARAAVSDEKFHGMSLLEQWLIEGKMSTKDAISHSINMLGAGMDTTAHTTAFVLYSLSKHPKVQEKAYKQITSVLGDDEEPDGDSLQKMPYLGHLIKETQRLYPVAPFVPRMLDTDIDLLGYHIPAKTTIVPGLEAMGQDPK
uniref:Cytochrome P450 n=1 Tax=Amphimedon queenslandica TaxID=400682 RepID=A0A1X7T918_AMPQE